MSVDRSVIRRCRQLADRSVRPDLRFRFAGTAVRSGRQLTAATGPDSVDGFCHQLLGHHRYPPVPAWLIVFSLLTASSTEQPCRLIRMPTA